MTMSAHRMKFFSRVLAVWFWLFLAPDSAVAGSPACAAPSLPKWPRDSRFERSFRVSIDVGHGSPDGLSVQRQALVQLPPDYDGTKSHPVLLFFHAVSSSAALTANYSQLDRLAGDNGWIVVFPEGMDDVPDRYLPPESWGVPTWQSWNGTGTVGSPSAMGAACAPGAKKVPASPCYKSCGQCKDQCWWTTCVDDSRFVEDLLDTLESALCTEPKKTVATGFSNGAIFLYELATNPRLSHRFAAFAPVAGLPTFGFFKDLPHPLSARFLGLWGRVDPGVPGFWSPGNSTFGAAPRHEVNIGMTGWYYWSAAEVKRRWIAAAAAAAGASSSAQEAGPFQTPFDGELGLSCEASKVASPGQLPAFIGCAWDGVHAWAGVAPGFYPVAPEHPALASRLLVHVLLNKIHKPKVLPQQLGAEEALLSAEFMDSFGLPLAGLAAAASSWLWFLAGLRSRRGLLLAEEAADGEVGDVADSYLRLAA
eukprot:TRINITY_DN113515_c0_g1_i1.p1 TRINITY_DN113515_c0_g1~~TRINITY_DN113515_c0_g1_i1.p1  ORF type:complete len:479 (-),score=57.71 TRINITY_DN113515_c0_g1_i1:240-1676(-)